jgi:predicted Zn-dependent protease with MMP-like domain
MNQDERDRFDRLLDQVLRDLPLPVRELFDEAPIIIEDRPSGDLLEELDLNPDDDTLCGLYTGTPMIERSVEDVPRSPDCIHIFREGVVQQAGGWEAHQEQGDEAVGGEGAIAREIRITILHELGHHFGLDEDDLERMGYQ